MCMRGCLCQLRWHRALNFMTSLVLMTSSLCIMHKFKYCCHTLAAASVAYVPHNEKLHAANEQKCSEKSAIKSIEENETKVEQNVNTFPLKIMSHKVRAITVTLEGKGRGGDGWLRGCKGGWKCLEIAGLFVWVLPFIEYLKEIVFIAISFQPALYSVFLFSFLSREFSQIFGILVGYLRILKYLK